MQISGSCIEQRWRRQDFGTGFEAFSALAGVIGDVISAAVALLAGGNARRRIRCRYGSRIGRRGARCQRDRHAVADLEVAGGDDDVSRRKSLQHFDVAVATLSDFDLHAVGAPIRDPEHILLVALRHDRLLRNDECILLVARDEPHAGEHTGSQ